MEDTAKTGSEDCCKKEENLEIVETTNPSVYIKRCRVCNKNHYHLKVQPMILNLRKP